MMVSGGQGAIWWIEKIGDDAIAGLCVRQNVFELPLPKCFCSRTEGIVHFVAIEHPTTDFVRCGCCLGKCTDELCSPIRHIPLFALDVPD